MPSTFVHALVPASCALLAAQGLPRLTRGQLVRLVMVAAFLGNAPDLDLIPASFFPDQWGLIHRAVGHNFIAILVWFWMGKQLLQRVVSKDISSTQAWTFSISLVLSHILFDALGARNHDGVLPTVPLLWPFTDFGFRLPWEVFACPKLEDHALHPFLRYVVSRHFWEQVFLREILTSFAFVAAWSVLYFTARFARRSRPVVTPEPQKTPESASLSRLA